MTWKIGRYRSEVSPPAGGAGLPPGRSGALRWLAAVPPLLALAGLVAAVVTLYGLAGNFMLEPTDDALFRAWVAQPMLDLGALSVLIAVVGIAAVALTKRRRRALGDAVAIVALAAVLSLLPLSLLQRESRLHPLPQLRSIATSVPVPPGYGTGVVSEVAPSQTSGAPRVDRVIDVHLPYPAVCTDLERALRGWAGAKVGRMSMLVHRPTGQMCFAFVTTPQGWGLYATVSTGQDFRTSPPTPLPAGISRVVLETTTPGQ